MRRSTRTSLPPCCLHGPGEPALQTVSVPPQSSSAGSRSLRSGGLSPMLRAEPRALFTHSQRQASSPSHPPQNPQPQSFFSVSFFCKHLWASPGSRTGFHKPPWVLPNMLLTEPVPQDVRHNEWYVGQCSRQAVEEALMKENKVTPPVGTIAGDTLALCFSAAVTSSMIPA